MLETVLHASTGHPDLVWVLIPSILSFIAGLGLGSFSNRFRTLVRQENTSTK